jgi:Domain of unknown function (DUF4382)
MKTFLSAVLLMSLVSCQSSDDSSTTQGTKFPVNISIGGYTTASLMNYIIPDAYAAVSELKVCFKRLRFKTSTNDSLPDQAEDNIDFNLGQVTLSNSGTLLGSVSVPAGTYYRVEFDLEPACAGKSLNLVNDFGTYSSAESLKIKFDGVFVVDGTETLELGVQDIMNVANSYNGTGNIADAFESVSGDM